MRIAIAADHNGVVLKARLIELLRARRARGRRPRRARRTTRSSTTRRCARTSAAASSTVAPTARSSSAAAGRARSSPATRSAASGRGCAPTCGTRRSPAATTTRTCWCSARRSIDAERAEQVLDTWLTTPFKGAEHARRIDDDRRPGAGRDPALTGAVRRTVSLQAAFRAGKCRLRDIVGGRHARQARAFSTESRNSRIRAGAVCSVCSATGTSQYSASGRHSCR